MEYDDFQQRVGSVIAQGISGWKPTIAQGEYAIDGGSIVALADAVLDEVRTMLQEQAREHQRTAGIALSIDAQQEYGLKAYMLRNAIPSAK